MWRLWTAVLVAVLGNFQYGISLTVVNTMLSSFSEDVGMDKNIGGAVSTGALYLGAAVGTLSAGLFKRLSGKYSQVWIGCLFATGSLLCGLTNEHKICWGGPFDGCVPDMVLFGRFATGLASGCTIVVSPRYLAEVSPPEIRGALCTLTETLIAVGVFTGLLIGLPLEFDVDIGYAWWRMMFLLSAIPAILQISLAFLTFPLFKHSNEELRESFKSSSKIIKVLSSAKQEELLISEDETPEALQDEELQNGHPSNTKPSEEMPLSKWERCKYTIRLLMERRYRRSVILGITVPSVCMLSGINLIGSYTTTIYEQAGLNHAIMGSAFFGCGELTGSLIALMLFDRLGRITMANISFTGMTLSQVAIALMSLVSKKIAGPLSVVFSITYNLSFGSGCGTLLLAYGAEVVPPELTGMVLGTGQCLSLFVSFIQVLIFPSILDAVGVLCSFLGLGAISMGCLVFLRVFMIETKGKELDCILSELATWNGR